MSYWPQYTYLALLLIGLGVGLAKHGEPRKPHNVVVDLIATAIVLWILSSGGFFKDLI